MSRSRGSSSGRWRASALGSNDAGIRHGRARRVFVAGATGVVGRRLTPALRDAGLEVRALVREAADAEGLPAGVEPVVGAVLDPGVVELPHGSDVIVHTASAVPDRRPAPSEAWARNDRIRRQGTRNLVNAARGGGAQMLLQSVTLLYADAGERWIDASNAQLRPSQNLVSYDTVSDVATINELIERAAARSSVEPPESVRARRPGQRWDHAALQEAGPLDGTVVVDTTNQFGAGGLEELPDGLSAVEANARRMPGALLAKAFNTLTAGYQRVVAEGRVDGEVAMLYAAEKRTAIDTAATLIEGCGFVPVHLGGWERVRLMEAPRRPGAVYGEAYMPEDARRIAAAPLDEAARLADELKMEER